MDIQSTRRRHLLQLLCGAGAVGLRSMATGLPISFLLDPNKAAAAAGTYPANPQFLIMSSSHAGDPVNCNVPGTYDDPRIFHPSAPEMAATSITLAGSRVQAARPWSTLPHATLDRTVFFHHSPLAIGHGSMFRVQSLMGGTAGGEMAITQFGKYLQPCLGTLQYQPISLGSGTTSAELLFSGGSPLAGLSPSSLKSLLLPPTGPELDLQKLRDNDLDALNKQLSRQGTAAAKVLLDQYALSQTQARSINQAFLNDLNALQDDTPASQLKAAVILCQMKVTPVVTVRMNFGEDNHTDVGLAYETAQTVASLSLIGEHMANLASKGMQDQLSFASFNVFGRTMLTDGNGRSHNAAHHVTVMQGANLRGGVVGGVVPGGGDYIASNIDSATGTAASGGDIPLANGLGAASKTLGAALGIDDTFLDANILLGKRVKAVSV